MKQVLLRDVVARNGFFLTLVNGFIANELSITEQQKVAMKKEARELAEEIKAEMDEMQKKVFERMTSHLNSEQMQVLREKLGDDFEAEIAPNIQRVFRELERIGK